MNRQTQAHLCCIHISVAWADPCLPKLDFIALSSLVLREETYLEKHYGQQYLDYKSRSGAMCEAMGKFMGHSQARCTPAHLGA
jgi:hypothetical protein